MKSFRKKDDDRPSGKGEPEPTLDELLAHAHEFPDETIASLEEHTLRLRAAAQRASVEELGAAASRLTSALGADPTEARLSAVERLTELRASGRISEEVFKREKARLEAYGR